MCHPPLHSHRRLALCRRPPDSWGTGGPTAERIAAEERGASLAEAVVEAEAEPGISETVAALEPVVVPEAIAAAEATPEPVEATPQQAAEAMPIQVFSLETGFSAVETEVPERRELEASEAA